MSIYSGVEGVSRIYRIGLVLVACWALLTSTPAHGSSDEWRTWTSKAGSQLEAKLVKRSGDQLELQRRSGGKPVILKLSQLSADDQQYVRELPEPEEEKGATSVSGVDAEPGVVSGEIKCLSESRWSYYLYLPESFHTAREWPVMLIMSPGGGKTSNPMNRYREVADRLGVVLVLSVQSKNGFGESGLCNTTILNDVYDRLPLHSNLAMTTGFSGGSRCAYLVAELDKRVAGVLACGSGHGIYPDSGPARSAKLRKSTYVYSLIGTNCFNRSEATVTHNLLSKNFRLRFFPSGHSWAGSPYIEEGMARLLGEAFMAHRSSTEKSDRDRYSKVMWQWTQEMVDDQPWEAHGWAEFLADFDGDSQVKSDAKSLANKLAGNDKVKQAQLAEKDIIKFVSKHYNKYIALDVEKKPNSSRAAEGEKLADKYPGLPHAELLEKLAAKIGK
ncbi:hypothetical protein [Persicirhabdus sediminis]|uniref:SLA1 homology domain-containing protein n=1 Tax=Persicirhabdus sediminis TaxID=454144 RepID=A0A8J7MFR4_9BACT|nr:hypothetical protein [Persicirhabdus sediminis]MBK1791975.1 hypothetical protein [Persicirhabdus sediminis]